MVPSKIKIESFAKRYHMGTLGGKGLMKFLSNSWSIAIDIIFQLYNITARSKRLL